MLRLLHTHSHTFTRARRVSPAIHVQSRVTVLELVSTDAAVGDADLGVRPLVHCVHGFHLGQRRRPLDHLTATSKRHQTY